MAVVRRYTKADEDALFAMIEAEGEEWQAHWQGTGRDKYVVALENSIVYIILQEGILCGFARCRDDDGFGVYVYDLLVDKAYRGQEYGRKLMERACKDFPDSTVYVMSDVNPYYEKLGYETEGTIFVVKMKDGEAT